MIKPYYVSGNGLDSGDILGNKDTISAQKKKIVLTVIHIVQKIKQGRWNLTCLGSDVT